MRSSFHAVTCDYIKPGASRQNQKWKTKKVEVNASKMLNELFKNVNRRSTVLTNRFLSFTTLKSTTSYILSEK